MIRNLCIAALTCAAFLPVTSAEATIRYDFTALSSFDVDVFGEFTGSFTYYSPTYLVPNLTVLAADLASCSAQYSIAGPANCTLADFTNDTLPGDDTIRMQTDNPLASVYYYFDGSAFSTAGTHDTVLFGDAQAGVLVVTDVGSSAPEPATWAMMLIGFAGLGYAGYRKSRRPAASAA